MTSEDWRRRQEAKVTPAISFSVELLRKHFLKIPSEPPSHWTRCISLQWLSAGNVPTGEVEQRRDSGLWVYCKAAMQWEV
jgi:hypothetical protein